MNFEVIGDKDRAKFSIFVSEKDYFATGGYKIYVGNLREMAKVIDIYPEYYIRVDSVGRSKKWRVMLLPEDGNGVREIDGTFDLKLTERVFSIINANV